MAALRSMRKEDIPFQRCVMLFNEERLRLLNYQSNCITKIESLDNLKNLVFLDFYNNSIEKIEGLDCLTNLRVLMLGRNKIQKIQALECLQKLDVLDLHSNQISSIENLIKLATLRVLNLEDNNITCMSNLPTQSLAELNLKRNQITSVIGVPSLTSLKRLVLSNNHIASFESIVDLLLSPSLIELTLESNPITQDQYYRLILANRVKSLKHLDGKRITEEEKRTALRIAKRETERRKETERVVSQAEERKRAIDSIVARWNLEMDAERRRFTGFSDYAFVVRESGKTDAPASATTAGKKAKFYDKPEDISPGVGGLIYTENSQMFMYGNESLALFEKADTTGITILHFHYIDIKKLYTSFSRIKRFTDVEHLTLSDNNLNSLKKLEALSQISSTKPLTITIENNGITKSPLFFSYALFRLCRFSHHNVIKKLNGIEVTQEMLDEAITRFGSLRAGLLKSSSLATMESFSRVSMSDNNSNSNPEEYFDAGNVRATNESSLFVEKMLTDVVAAHAKCLEFESLFPVLVKEAL
ncbi:hypothetical protein BDR26DRAFT_857606 [Obelidium mucronatum]|nr:hypothetical protein BDR26DRAFT_857606 [Obelidium mucronatum]